MYKRLSILVITGLFGVVGVDQVSATPYGGGAGTGAVVASSGASAGIPVTGADSGPVLLWALLAVGAGAALVGGVAVRRRHSASTDAA